LSMIALATHTVRSFKVCGVESEKWECTRQEFF
jgi:hypothetical protein